MKDKQKSEGAWILNLSLSPNFADKVVGKVTIYGNFTQALSKPVDAKRR